VLALVAGPAGAFDAGTAGSPAVQPAPSRDAAEARLRAARRFAIVLQDVAPEAVDAADPDVLVVDYSRDGGAAGELSPADVDRLRRRAGAPRLVLAYVSIGEAERWRFYWDGAARGGKAAFVEGRNPQWPGDFRVRFWDPAWREVLAGGPGSYVDRVAGQGFDGVFLDTVDVVEVWEDRGRRDAPQRMGELIRAIADAARARSPAFLVVASNPFRVLDEPGVVEALSGVLEEGNLLRGERLAPGPSREAILGDLRRLRARGKAVLAVEYPRSAAGRTRFAELCADEGFPGYAGPKELDRIGTIVEPGRGVPAGGTIR
jgi:cysteinyl-tRNA synthetase